MGPKAFVQRLGGSTRARSAAQDHSPAVPGAQGPSQVGSPEGSLSSHTALASSQIPPQPRRAAPATPPPPVKRRDREALVASGSGERQGWGNCRGAMILEWLLGVSGGWRLQACGEDRAHVGAFGGSGVGGEGLAVDLGPVLGNGGSGLGGVQSPGGCPSTASTLCPQAAATPRPPGAVLCPVAPQSAVPPLTRFIRAPAHLSWAPAAPPLPHQCPAAALIPLCPKLSPLPPRCQSPTPLQRRWQLIHPQPPVSWRPWVH